MKHMAMMVTVASAFFFVQTSVANEECNYTWVLVNTDGSAATADQYAEKDRREAECKRMNAETRQRGADARARLQSEFGVDAGSMSDSEAIARLASETSKRRNAEQAAAEADAERAEKQRQEHNDALLRNQDAMLESMGLSVDAVLGDEDENDDEDEVDPAELKQYQEKLDNGVAPHCRRLTGWAMIDCVDAATVED